MKWLKRLLVRLKLPKPDLAVIVTKGGHRFTFPAGTSVRITMIGGGGGGGSGIPPESR